MWGGLVEDGGGGGGGGWGAGFVGGGEGDSNVTWSNEAHVQVTTGFDEERWLSANYVAKITGLLYNDLRGARAYVCRGYGACLFLFVCCWHAIARQPLLGL